jgi:hypothetical protein
VLVPLAIALLALASCTTATGSDPAGRTEPTDPPRRYTSPGPLVTDDPVGGPVLMLGDSLLVGAELHGGLEDKLIPDDWDPEIIAESGRTVGWGAGEISDRDHNKIPRFVVVVLGTNPNARVDGCEDDVEVLLSSLRARGGRRIVWIPPYHAEDDRYDEKLQVLAGRVGGGLVVPDWGGVLDANPEWVTGDGIHLTEEGYQALAWFIRDELARLR